MALSSVIAGLILLFSLANIFYPIVFVIDENSVYHGLPLRDIMLVVQIVLLLMISVYAGTAIDRQPNE